MWLSDFAMLPHITWCMWLSAAQLTCFVFSSHFRIHLSHIKTTVKRSRKYYFVGEKNMMDGCVITMKMGWLWSSLSENKIKYRVQSSNRVYISGDHFIILEKKNNDCFVDRSELDGYVFTCILFHSCLWTILL